MISSQNYSGTKHKSLKTTNMYIFETLDVAKTGIKNTGYM